MDRKKKFSQGIWEIIGDHICIQTSIGVKTVCSINTSGRLSERQANANLITAAPELLEALEEKCNSCSDEHSYPKIICQNCSTRLIIAKAYGETK